MSTPMTFSDLKQISEEHVIGKEASATESPASRLLSDFDNCFAGFGAVIGAVLLEDNVNAALLKESLGKLLTDVPFLGGRLAFMRDGRLDIIPPAHLDPSSPRGARFVAASSSATLPQLAAARGAGRRAGAAGGGGGGEDAATEVAGRSAPVVSSPWGRYMPPMDVGGLVRGQHPLLSVFLLHLSGGGSVLWLSAHHVIADFHTLQALAAALSAAYNAALASHNAAPGDGHQQQQPAVASASPSSAAPAPIRGSAPPALCLDAAALEAHAWAGPGALPPGVPPPRDLAAAPWWGVAALVWAALYHMLWRGGGVQSRLLHVPPSRLAALKARAMRELAEEEGGAGGGEDGGGGDAPTAARVAWVSTHDALVARLAQVLHSRVPARRAAPCTILLGANMRARLAPPLPPGHLGNRVFGARLELGAAGGRSLGALAADVRAGIQGLVPRFQAALAHVSRLVGRVGARRISFGALLAPRPRHNILAPEGPLVVSNWDVDYAKWQFGPSPPLAFWPVFAAAPNAVVTYPAPAVEGGGVMLHVGLHAVAWRALEAAGGDLAEEL